MDEDKLLVEMMVEASRSSFLAFLEFVWWAPWKLQVGRHTAATCNRLTRAVFDYLEGRSTFLVINMPFRHGKTDMVSKAFPAWFLGVCSQRQPDVMITGYGQSLAADLSVACKRIIESDEYQMVFPGVQVDPARDAKETWGIDGSVGVVNCTGLSGALTGKGYALGICDDYCKSREEAFSLTYREKTWDKISVDFMTRRAPVSITIIVATTWHPDDVIGRVKDHMVKTENFPQFEFLIFPAHVPGKWNTLFPERYPESWYKEQRATLGNHMAAALLDCNPLSDANTMFNPLWFQTLDKLPERNNLKVFIIIDSANGKRKANDYTSMWVIGLGMDRNRYVLDGVREQLNLVERTRVLFNLVELWTPERVFWEQNGAMSDAQHVKIEQDRLGWHFVIQSFSQSVPKEDRVAWLIPEFEQGRIWFPAKMLKRGQNNSMYDLTDVFFREEFTTYPAVVHDDMLDCMAHQMHPAVAPMMKFPISPMASQEGVTYKTTSSKWRPW